MDAPRIEDPADHAADVEHIRGVIGAAQVAFNTGDADLLVESAADTVMAVGVTGERVVGRAAMREAAGAAFAGPSRGRRSRYDLLDVTFVRSDVALATMRATAVDGDGTPVDVGHAMTALHVLVRESGRWWVVARQDTLVR